MSNNYPGNSKLKGGGNCRHGLSVLGLSVTAVLMSVTCYKGVQVEVTVKEGKKET